MLRVEDLDMAERKLSPQDEFDKALRERAALYGAGLGASERERLGEYFALVSKWNPRLHLFAPCSPTEFAARHVLESLLALPHLPTGARVVDVGSGAGLPVIPCLVARPDSKATLVESSRKKAIFLREALNHLRLGEAARVVAARFEETETPEADALTCRAIERFAEILPELERWSRRVPSLLLFGGPNLREAMEASGLTVEAVPVPESERRYLFVARR